MQYSHCCFSEEEEEEEEKNMMTLSLIEHHVFTVTENEYISKKDIKIFSPRQSKTPIVG